jgi:sugar phosphate isomerase/epimerase
MKSDPPDRRRQEVSNLPILYPIWFLDPKPLRKCVEEIAAAGFDGVTFAAAPLDDPRRLDNLQGREASELRRFLKSLGLMRSLHIFSDQYFAGQTQRTDRLVKGVQQSIERCVEALASDDEPPLIVSLDPICLPPFQTNAVDVDLVVEMLGFLVPLSEQLNVRAALENWPKPEVETPEALRRLLSRVRGPVGILLDTGHLHMALRRSWCEAKTPAEFIRALPAEVLEVHLHDNHGDADEHLPPGAGTADLAGIMRTLIEAGFRGPVTLECDLRPKGRPSPAEALQNVRQLCTLPPSGCNDGR